MDDYRDVDESYRRALERVVLDAGLALPSIYGEALSEKQKRDHDKRVREWREKHRP